MQHLLLLVSSLLSGASPGAADVPSSRTVRFTYEAHLEDISPETELLRLWVPVAGSDESQEIQNIRVETVPDVKYRILKDAVYENRALFIQLDRADGELPKSLSVRIITDLKRSETSRMSKEAMVAGETLLAGDQLAPLTNDVVERSEQATVGANTALERARQIYDRVLADVDYDKSGAGWGRGDIHHVCEEGKGNCSDFHTLFVAMSRAAAVPAVFEIGFPIPPEPTASTIGGYHCWAWFQSDDGAWYPIDASEADKDPVREEYFFGTIDENRIAFSRGRDVVFVPGPESGPINFFVYPVAEINGGGVEVRTELSYQDLGS